MAETTPKHGLTRHPRGWVKTINGKTRWVCSNKVAPDAAAADAVYEQRMSELWQAPAERPSGDVVTVTYLVDRFLERKLNQVEAKELARRTYDEYVDLLNDFKDSVGRDTPAEQLGPRDYGLFRDAAAKRFGPDRLAKWLIGVRGLLKYALAQRLLDRPADFGDSMRLPTRAAFRKHKAEHRRKHGLKLFTPEESRLLVEHARRPVQHAMILLGLTGFGNTDLATLPRGAVDLEGGWIDYARTKTGIERRVPLWPEHVKALKAVLALARRPQPGAEGLVFLTPEGNPYIAGTKDQVAMAFKRLCGRIKGVDGKTLERKGRNFYTLRRTARTWMDDVGDQRAAALMMGHGVTDIGGVYVQRISDERLKLISDSLRDRVFPRRSKAARGAGASSKKTAGGKKASGGGPARRGGKPAPGRGRSGSEGPRRTSGRRS